jgi:hypothetical protein
MSDFQARAALNFYRKFGFAKLGNDSNRVFLTMGTIELRVAKRV